jgi:AcrR family transcriptional regulator
MTTSAASRTSTGRSARSRSESRPAHGDARRALLDAVGADLATRGPRSVVLAEICDALGLAPAIVNYHFGNRDRLLAEAVVHEYDKLVDEMNTSTLSITTSAEDQFRERFAIRFRWTANHAGIDSMLNYTHVLDPSGTVLTADLQERMGTLTTSDMSGLSTCLVGMFHNTVVNELVTTDHPLYDPRVAEVTAFVALSALGAATFLTGQHPGSVPLATQFPVILATMREEFTTRMIAHLRCEFDQMR